MAHIIDWRLDLMMSHPRLFHVMADEPHLSFGYPLCEQGWRDILERLCGSIEAALRDGETFEFVRIKQKFGLVRIDWDGEVSCETRARIEEAVSLAEARSSCTCELCGAEGAKYYASKKVMVRCEAHAEGRPVMAARGNERLHLVRVVEPPEPRVRKVRRYDRETDAFVGSPENIDASLPRGGAEPDEDC
jgi:hypothetical protein